MAILTEQEAIQIRMYGEKVDDVVEGYNMAFNKGIYIMGILSDAQYVLEAFDDQETARQYMNKAKYLISRFGVKIDEDGRIL